MLHWSELHISEIIFTHVLPSGENINIASGRLRELLVSPPPGTQPPPPLLIPVDPKVAQSFIDKNIVNLNRVKNLRVLHCREPIILCEAGTTTFGRPDVFFVDGHHRYTRAFLEGCPVIEAWVVPTQVWSPFIITGLPSQTHSELEAFPVLPDQILYGSN